MTTTTSQKRPEHHLPAFVRFAVQFIRMNLSLAVSGEKNTSKRAYKYWKSPYLMFSFHKCQHDGFARVDTSRFRFWRVNSIPLASPFLSLFFSSFTQSLCRISFFCYYTYLFNIKIWAFLPFVKHGGRARLFILESTYSSFLRLIYNSY